MSLIEIIFIAIGLSLDAFAVALCVGSSGASSSRRDVFRLSFHFGLFQFMMPLIGWYFGTWIAQLVAHYDHWVAFMLLAIVGGRMIKEGTNPEPKAIIHNPTKGLSLVLLSLATSIDALAVGFSLAILHITIFTPSVLIGCITASFTFAGMKLGNKLSASYGSKMEIIGGIVLILIGLKVLLEHLL